MKPILFNTEMVRAILEGRKTVTRRVMKPQPVLNGHFWELGGAGWSDTITSFAPMPCHSLYNRCPFHVGDILYVRETWCDPTPDQSGWPILYKADMPMHWDAEDVEFGEEVTLKAEDYKWRPSIHMPKEAARIFLKVTRMQFQRLQDITSDQCAAEGIELFCGPADIREAHYISSFAALWDTTIRSTDRHKYGWEANPWVWVIEFERCKRPEGSNDNTY